MDNYFYKERKILCKDTNEIVYGYKSYLQTLHWKNLRTAIAEKYDYTCERCNSVFKHDFIIHHTTYKRLGKEKLTDLSFLCNKCHTIIHKNKQAKKQFNKEYHVIINAKLSKLSEDKLQEVLEYIDKITR